jgi:hypothetical protein
MFRSKLLAGILSLVFTSVAMAQDGVATAASDSAPATSYASPVAAPAAKATGKIQSRNVTVRPPRPLKVTTIAVSFLSWNEPALMANGSVSDRSIANFFGNAITYERENYKTTSSRFGWVYQASLMLGQANIGGNQSKLTYQLANQHWMGAQAGARCAYRIAKSIAVSLGGWGMYRSITIPNDPSGTQATVGPPENFGATVDLRMRLFPNLELRQELGTTLINVSTYWSLGLGYKF